MAKIFVVDDEPDNINLLTYELEDDGHTVVTAKNGQECLDNVKSIVPDVILLDLNMPVLNGMETLKQLKSELSTSSIPVIMLTCNDDEQSIVQAMDMGAHDYVGKPMIYPVIAARMRSALRLRESQKQLSRANQSLAKIAYKDPLTDTYNRRFFASRSDEEFKKARRYKRHLSVIMLDVDHFKEVNDRFGHGMGDAALIEIAMMCRAQIRSEDFVGRMGGEEFCICCPETDLKGATLLAERIRVTILDHAITHADDTCTCTISFGVTDIHDDDKDFD